MILKGVKIIFNYLFYNTYIEIYPLREVADTTSPAAFLVNPSVDVAKRHSVGRVRFNTVFSLNVDELFNRHQCAFDRK